MYLINKIKEHGLLGSARIATGMAKRRLRQQIDPWRFRNAPKYANPTDAELSKIESDLARLSIAVSDYIPPPRSIPAISTGGLVPRSLPWWPRLGCLG